jgi:hypothetical protein
MNRCCLSLGLLVAAVLIHTVGLLEGSLSQQTAQPVLRPVAPLQVSSFKGTVFTLERNQLRARLIEAIGHEPEIHLADDTYVIIRKSWMIELWRWMSWSRQGFHLPEDEPAIAALELNQLLIAAASLAERDPRREIPGAVILGEMEVSLDLPWGWVPAGSVRDLILFYSDAGFFVVDVMTGQATPLEHFPNRDGIRVVLL